jgi:hypothetical protein
MLNSYLIKITKGTQLDLSLVDFIMKQAQPDSANRRYG